MSQLALPRPAPISHERRLVAAGAALIILAVSGLETGQLYLRSLLEGWTPPAGHLAARTFASFALLALMAPLLLAMGRRFPLGRPLLPQRLLAHLLSAVGFAFVHLAGTALAVDLIQSAEHAYLDVLSYLLVTYFALDLVLYAAIAGAQHAMRYLDEAGTREVAASELRATLAQARLDALRTQLNPHFLFNTLNGISGMALKGDRDGVADAIARLSALLRLSLGRPGPEAALIDELEIVGAYVELQRLRFGDAVSVTVAVPPALERAALPVFLLQPLVENALIHGIGERGPGWLRIAAREKDGRLCLTVTNSSASPPEYPSGRRGTGLANCRARLEALHGAASSLELVCADDTATVDIRLPLRFLPPTEQEER